MAEIMKEEPDIEENDIKEKICIQEDILPSSTVEDTCTVYLQEAILPSSTVEDACTVYLQEEHVGMDATEIKGKQ